MIAYPDTSFLCALYRAQVNSPRAAEHFRVMPEPVFVSSPLLFEFRQSLRWQVYLYSKDSTKGFLKQSAQLALNQLNANISTGAIILVSIDWSDVVSIAERLSSQYTWTLGYRGFDLLHAATALHLGVTEFLTFDVKQKQLAEAEGLIVPF